MKLLSPQIGMVFSKRCRPIQDVSHACIRQTLELRGHAYSMPARAPLSCISLENPCTLQARVGSQGKTKYRQKAECCAGALEGRYIATLCQLSRAKTVLEVGMFTGTTTLAVAEVLPADGKVCLKSFSPNTYAFSEPTVRKLRHQLRLTT